MNEVGRGRARSRESEKGEEREGEKEREEEAVSYESRTAGRRIKISVNKRSWWS